MTDAVAEQVLAALRQRGQTLATAESLTGGLIGQLLTEVPGASHSYLGGVITYATQLKADLAGVDPETLARYGPVAAITAEQMAAGVAQRCGAHWGLAVTGVAGPEPQDGHPVGQVFLAVAQPGNSPAPQVVELQLSGERTQIRRQTAEQALLLLAQELGMRPQSSGVE
ncbi:MAG: C-terminal domain of CinA type S [uncultured Propionibacteriaceae bacterium]|uniref:C-terminal domain of CinA type S n=1 Tax=uncultured Propionibacteriaceae bacterium TaxID=257457 RepID=A0A6J4P5H5_9ACTN|nr:MAG: C-terminal domain of CinA type S [uncultured Propionibacteriaceae bacterium]